MHSILDWVTLGAVAALPFWWKFVGTYLFSYATEKGKNLATKEDIATITHLIESAKVQHAAELEQIKSDIAVQASRNSVFAEHRRQAFLTFYELTLNFVSDAIQTFTAECLVPNGEIPKGMGSIAGVKQISGSEEALFRQIMAIKTACYRIVLYHDRQDTGAISAAAAVVNNVQSFVPSLLKNANQLKQVFTANYPNDLQRILAQIGKCNETVGECKRATRQAFRAYQTALNAQFLREAGMEVPALSEPAEAEESEEAEDEGAAENSDESEDS